MIQAMITRRNCLAKLGGWTATLALTGPIAATWSHAQAADAPKKDLTKKDADAKLVWTVGDSTAQAVGEGLQFQVRNDSQILVKNIFRNASGLMRPDFFNWPKTIAGILARESAPKVVVITLGANDTQGIVLPDKKTIAKPGEDAWHTQYTERVNAFLKLFSDAGTTTLLIGQPYDPSKRFAPMLAAVNKAFRASAAQAERVQYIDSEQLLLSSEGAYQNNVTTESGQHLVLRNADGVHLTADGGRYLGRFLVQEIKPILAPQPAQ
jgi:uncharacterized protein